MMFGTELVNHGKFVECLKFIHDEFIPDLEMAMGGVVKAQATYKQKCKLLHVRDSGNGSVESLSWFEAANDWLVMQNIGDFSDQCNRYISCVFPPIEMPRATSCAPDPDSIAALRGRILHHQKCFHFPSAKVYQS